MLQRGRWYRYLTNDRDEQRLPAGIAIALYGQRWRIEDAYAKKSSKFVNMLTKWHYNAADISLTC